MIADAVRLERLGDLPSVPEIQVFDASGEIVDGQAGSIDFGSTFVGVPVSRVFTVRNVGQTSLVVQQVNVPIGFSVTPPTALGTLAAGGGQATFTVQLTAVAAGSFSGDVSFDHSDGDENPFNFPIAAQVTDTVRIMDNGDPGFAATSAWAAFPGQGLGNDVHFVGAGNGSQVAAWTFAVTPGQYQAAATWTTHANRATNAAYRIVEGGTLWRIVRVSQEQAPASFQDQGVLWQELGGIIYVTGNTLSIQLSNDANEYVIADAVRLQRLGDLPTGPEIQLFGPAGEIIDGTATPFDLGATFVGVPVQRSFSVRNVGQAPLTVQQIIPPAGFSVVPAAPLGTLAAGGGTAAFTLQLDAAGAGTFMGDVSFLHDDTDENPFNFAVTGRVGTARILDNGDAGFSTVGHWGLYSEGHQNDIHAAGAGGGAQLAIWTFSVTPGQYRAAATWPAHANRATHALLEILNGSSSLGNVALNQQQSPDDFSLAETPGTLWEHLGGIRTITSNTVVIRLSDLANGYVIADAVRLERIGDLPPGPATVPEAHEPTEPAAPAAQQPVPPSVTSAAPASELQALRAAAIAVAESSNQFELFEAEPLQVIRPAAIVLWDDSTKPSSVMDRWNRQELHREARYHDLALLDLDVAGDGWFLELEPLDNLELGFVQS